MLWIKDKKRRLRKQLYDKAGGRCHWCNCRMRFIWRTTSGEHDPDEATLDHRHPLSRGGPNSPHNQVIACSECNFAKADTLERTFKKSAYLRTKIRHVREIEQLEQQIRELGWAVDFVVRLRRVWLIFRPRSVA